MMVMLWGVTNSVGPGLLTVTAQVAFLPLWVLTVMVALPVPTAVTRPALLTVATDLLELAQV